MPPAVGGPQGYTPPEGGWGWMVVIGAFISIGFSYAFPKSITVFFKEIEVIFNVTSSQVSWISSIMLAVTYGGGELQYHPRQAAEINTQLLAWPYYIYSFSVLLQIRKKIIYFWWNTGLLCSFSVTERSHIIIITVLKKLNWQNKSSSVPLKCCCNIIFLWSIWMSLSLAHLPILFSCALRLEDHHGFCLCSCTDEMNETLHDVTLGWSIRWR